MEHQHSIYDNDTHFVIDLKTREIKNDIGKTVIVQNDHNSERFSFELPKEIEGHDMSLCNVVQVHYLNIDSKTKEQHEGLYIVDDLQISPDGDDVVILSWLLSQEATRAVGSLYFGIVFKCIEEDGTLTYSWHTTVNKDFKVVESLDNSNVILEENPDILAQFEARLAALEENGGGGSGNGKGIVSIYAESFELGGTETKAKMRVLYTDGTDSYFDFSVPNGESGVGIERIEKTETNGLVDTYTIFLSDGNTSTFTVTNGSGGGSNYIFGDGLAENDGLVYVDFEQVASADHVPISADVSGNTLNFRGKVESPAGGKVILFSVDLPESAGGGGGMTPDGSGSEVFEIPTKTSQLENDSGFITKKAVEPLSDVKYLGTNLFDPENITHNSRYVTSNGLVYTGSSTACRTTNFIELDSTKEYNLMLYMDFEGKETTSKPIVLTYDSTGQFIQQLTNRVDTNNATGKVAFFHITEAAYIGFYVGSWSEIHPDTAPAVMIWESTNPTEYEKDFVEYGGSGGSYSLPRLVVDTDTTLKKEGVPADSKAVGEVTKSHFYNKFLNVSYSTFEDMAHDNTMETYLTACKLGFDAIKGDVRITADDKLVMCHDEGFTFAGNGKIKTFEADNCTIIREVTFEECKSYEYGGAGSLVAGIGHNPKVASFEDYIKICREHNKVAYITVRDEYIDTIAPLVIECLKKYNMIDNSIINSFTIETLQKFRAINNRIMLSNVLGSKTALTKAHINTILPLGNCMVCVFPFPFDNAWEVMENSREAFEYAQDNGVLVYGAQVLTYEDYIKCIEYGLSGLHLKSVMFPYEPQRYNFKITVTDGVAVFSDEFRALRYTATVTQGESTISISDIRLNGSDRGFDDGLMQLWLNKLPYTLDVREESGKTCSASYSNGAITISTNGETSATYHLSVMV